MTIPRNVYTTQQLLGVYRELKPITPFWLKFFPGLVQSDAKTIEWSKIHDYRHLAPLVLPTNTGRPTAKANEEMYSVKPAYIKAKDAVDAASMTVAQVGLGEMGMDQQLSPGQRYDAKVAALLSRHRSLTENRWEWMAAQAMLYGSITLTDDGFPTATVDFRRDAGHSITLGGGARWGDSGVVILDLIDAWNDTMADAKFGGAASVILMGATAWKAFKADAGVKALMDKNYAQTSGTYFDLGVGNGSKYQFKGRLSASLEVWTYADYYQDPDDSVVPFMDPRDILMISGDGPAGVKAFGAILDKRAGLASMPFFPKMWDEEDPSATLVMSQSAPLMVPIHPNRTLRARVVA